MFTWGLKFLPDAGGKPDLATITQDPLLAFSARCMEATRHLEDYRGASAPGLQDIHRMQHQLTRQVRAITHLFAHLSKVSAQDLHRRFRLSTVLDMLHKEAHALHRQLQHHETFGHTVAELHLNSARGTAARLQAWQMQPQTPAQRAMALSADAEAPFQCRTCGRAYSTYRLLRVHESAEHSKKAPKTDEVQFDRSIFTVSRAYPRVSSVAMPSDSGTILSSTSDEEDVLSSEDSPSQCRPLLKSQHTRPLLQVMYTWFRAVGHCRPLLSPAGCPSSAPLPGVSTQPTAHTAPLCNSALPLIERQEILQRLQEGQWVSLACDTTVQQYLMHHCPVCFQWWADALD